MSSTKGSVLAITVGFIVIFMIFGLTSIYLSGLQNVTADKNVASTQAFWLADGGVQKGYWKMNDAWNVWSSDQWQAITSGYASKNPTAVGPDGYYEIQVTDYDSATPLIRAYGYVPFLDSTPISKDSPNYAKRIVELSLHRNTFENSAVGDEFISMQGNAITDSYSSVDSSYVGHNGDVATNGDITIGGNNPLIDGDASTGSSGTFNETEHVTGEITHDNNIPLPSVIVPEELLALPNEGILKVPPAGGITGNHKYSSIQLTQPLLITGEASIYLTGEANADVSLFIKGPGQLVISGGPVEIYADGNVNVSGQGILNQTEIPSNFLFYGTGKIPTATMKFSGQSEFYGAIYAPDTPIIMDGQGLPDEKYGIYGAVVGKSITLGGNAAIHYDERLNEDQYSEDRYSPMRWSENFNLL